MMTIRTSVSLILDGLRSVKQNVEIRRELRHQAVGLVALDVVGLSLIERDFGRPTCEKILSTLKRFILQLDREISVRIIAVKSVGDDFSLFVSIPMVTGGLSRERFLSEEARKIKSILEKRLGDATGPEVSVQLHMGSSMIRPAPDMEFQAVLYNAMKEANHQAKHVDLEEQRLLQEFTDIVNNKRLESHFQPIVSLTTGERFGMEALLRGPLTSDFRSPERLFNFAQKTNELTGLDRLALERAITTFGSVGHGGKLFLNVDSRTLMDPIFKVHNVLSLLEQSSLIPHDVVLEITERNWVGNYVEFNENLDPYRRVGFAVAVDDAGMGYSSLQAITELRPDYIKVDKSLIQHIDHEMVKSAMLETLVDFARKVNSSVIAEGIETEEELHKLINLGIDYGQGYLLGKPSPLAAVEGLDAIKEVIRLHTSADAMGAGKTVTVGKLTRQVQTFDELTRVSEVAQYFHVDERQPSVVILRGTRPIGLVMRDKLMGHLATQYGVPLYWHRSIDKLMDPAPLIVESTMALDVASRLSMERDHEKVYDSIIINHRGAFVGIITIQDILSTINTIQLERARGSNPLTGLPGNQNIKREIRTWITSNKAFFIIYADIDHFKWFNDCYGFHRGDHVIQFLSDVLTQVCHEGVNHDCFVGHIGGDDFIVITDHPSPASWCDEVIELFDQGITRFYSDDQRPSSDVTTDRMNVIDRDGNQVSTDGLTLSLSLLQCTRHVTALTLEDVVEEVARLKKLAKGRTGSTCIASTIDGEPVTGAPTPRSPNAPPTFTVY